jgi:hypothetical protein
MRRLHQGYARENFTILANRHIDLNCLGARVTGALITLHCVFQLPDDVERPAFLSGPADSSVQVSPYQRLTAPAPRRSD